MFFRAIIDASVGVGKSVCHNVKGSVKKESMVILDL